MLDYVYRRHMSIFLLFNLFCIVILCLTSNYSSADLVQQTDPLLHVGTLQKEKDNSRFELISICK